MARKFLTPIDLTGLEILNVRFQNLATAPTPKGDGHVYYNTTDETVYVYDGANWQASGKIVAGTLASRPAAGSSGRLYFATDATEQVLYYDNGTTWTKVGESKKYIDDSISTAVTNHNASSGVHGVTGSVVGTSDTQTLTNKTLTSPKVNEDVALLATSTELNILDGATLTTTELNYVDGVTSSIQTQLDGKTGTGHTHTASNITDFAEAAQDAVGGILGSGLTYTDATPAITIDSTVVQLRVTNVTDTEIGYLDGVTSSIQTQLGGKASTTDLTNHTGASTGVHGITGAVVGTTDTQSLSNKTLASDLAAGNFKITGLADPTSAQDAATKAYVDTAVQGIDWKASVRAATTAQLTLATDLENGDVIDGVTLATGNRVLVKNQSNGSQNGIYVVKATGAPDRATDADTATEVTSNFAVFVEEGDANADSGWTLTNDGSVTIGTTALTFTQFTGLGQVVAGDGLTKTGNTLNVVAGTGITVTSDAVAIDTSLVARKYAVSVGNGALTSFVLTHNFNTRDVTVTVYDAATYAEVFTDAAHSTVNTVTVAFAEAPTTDQYRVVIVG
jgi:hypothetical protein